ncbi:AAA family ATPase [Mucilaginibacter sp.]|uniref:AAA family ATPase n=1 Tax=Mucilaginibacter sp. TaxID=1882438 RepID=UPI0025E1DD26|nr:AAA family ATPase [Mucilaginibacter sp.]
MTKLAEKTEIKTAVNHYCKVKGISKNELATQLNISASTLSSIENENWKSIDQKMWQKIWNKVGRINDLKIFHTKDFKAVEDLCTFSRNNFFMTGLIADTGMGKTTALTSYSHRTKETFYVSYDKTMKPRQFFAALLKEMSIQFDGSINEMVNRIADELNVMESPLVIIDEAGKITHTMIVYLQVLKDKTPLSCGYVLAGMPYFKTNLIKFANKQKEGYAEFYRRVNLWHELEGLSGNDIVFICTESGITNQDDQKQFRHKRRFGDLANEILLKKLNARN